MSLSIRPSANSPEEEIELRRERMVRKHQCNHKDEAIIFQAPQWIPSVSAAHFIVAQTKNETVHGTEFKN